MVSLWLQDKLNPKTRMNPTTHSEGGFWSRVGTETLAQIMELYRTDFVLFGYSCRDYLSNLGVPFDLEKITL